MARPAPSPAPSSGTGPVAAVYVAPARRTGVLKQPAASPGRGRAGHDGTTLHETRTSVTSVNVCSPQVFRTKHPAGEAWRARSCPSTPSLSAKPHFTAATAPGVATNPGIRTARGAPRHLSQAGARGGNRAGRLRALRSEAPPGRRLRRCEPGAPNGTEIAHQAGSRAAHPLVMT